MRRASLFMKLEAKKLLFDVITACRDFEDFTAGKAFYDYLENEMLRTAVEHKTKRTYRNPALESKFYREFMHRDSICPSRGRTLLFKMIMASIPLFGVPARSSVPRSVTPAGPARPPAICVQAFCR